jgi:endonuclease/exonuclease/phosphatase family metal-dependent hydrolase
MFLSFVCGRASSASPLKVMTFNTMCSLCDSKHKAGPFKERFKNIADTVLRHDPDLLSFQEILTKSQVRKMASYLGKKYEVLYGTKSLYPATDATLFVKKDRFTVMSSDGVWLGPKLPKFSFGWKPKIPRRFHWAQLKDNSSGLEFLFVGSHFDNSFKNKNHSAAYANSFFSQASVPVIFGGDTNLEPAFDGYGVLLGKNMRDSFAETAELKYYANTDYTVEDGCGNSEAKWPACRIDHVLLSSQAPWKVKTWGVDVYRYYKNTEFVSDHRAVIVELE